MRFWRPVGLLSVVTRARGASIMLLALLVLLPSLSLLSPLVHSDVSAVQFCRFGVVDPFRFSWAVWSRQSFSSSFSVPPSSSVSLCLPINFFLQVEVYVDVNTTATTAPAVTPTTVPAATTAPVAGTGSPTVIGESNPQQNYRVVMNNNRVTIAVWLEYTLALAGGIFSSAAWRV